MPSTRLTSGLLGSGDFDVARGRERSGLLFLKNSCHAFSGTFQRPSEQGRCGCLLRRTQSRLRIHSAFLGNLGSRGQAQCLLLRMIASKSPLVRFGPLSRISFPLPVNLGGHVGGLTFWSTDAWEELVLVQSARSTYQRTIALGIARIASMKCHSQAPRLRSWSPPSERYTSAKRASRRPKFHVLVGTLPPLAAYEIAYTMQPSTTEWLSCGDLNNKNTAGNNAKHACESAEAKKRNKRASGTRYVVVLGSL
ncbi:hypothetical protein R3P38DRAFT_1441427 [Favolaschia claudopus]|uniref:Uncharacterized protein n=1 Tax=Favolaschia claudopus TaxID=2862362 RepID=A0AAW0AMM3_9AGAR